ncbi:Caffeic acid 3-O-methyltransferase [Vigna angularis]|uniref:Caffeic acid 3-O-methyltransferase n=1 Tax=Phaseolus angularis TaxID=3914 RepID=A0A8T0LFD0_PHAAN|nr:Caffeic acid 3-O-methyltransferase [Vigna angularis]
MYITSPSPPSLLLLTGKTPGSLGPFMTLAHDKASLRSWYQLKDAILEGGIPFNRAHGKHLFEYSDMNPSFNNLFTATMTNCATIIMNKIVESYHRDHVHFAFQKDPSSQPAFLNELATPIIGQRVREEEFEVASGVRVEDLLQRQKVWLCHQKRMWSERLGNPEGRGANFNGCRCFASE